jgi:hypothetical protein
MMVVATDVRGDVATPLPLAPTGASDGDCTVVATGEAETVPLVFPTSIVPRGEDVVARITFPIWKTVGAAARTDIDREGLPPPLLDVCELPEELLDEFGADAVEFDVDALVTFAVKLADALTPSAVVTTSCKLCWPAGTWIGENCSGKVPLGKRVLSVCICCGVPSINS